MKQATWPLAKKTLGFYLRENLKHKKILLSVLVTWTSGMLLQKLVLPLIVANAFDKIIRLSSAGSIRLGDFTIDLLCFVVALIVSQTLIDLGLVLNAKMEAVGIQSLHDRVYSHLLSQSARFHNNTFAGSLVSQANRFVGGYVTATDTLLISVTQLTVLTVFSSIVLAFYSPLLAAVVFTWVIVFFYLNLRLTRGRIAFSKARAAADSVVTGSLADSVGNIGAIKSFGSELFEFERHTKITRDRAFKGYRYAIRSTKNDAVFGIMMGIAQLLVLVSSIIAIEHGSITVGTLVLAQIYVTQMLAALWGVSGISKNLEQSLSDAAEMTEILEIVPEIQDANTATELKVSAGAIEFNRVQFTHAEKTDALFKNLSFSIKPGEKIGLIGTSGGGKTTITKLLLRLIDIQGGMITIDGQNIQNVTQVSLRDAISYVPQEPILFHRSLAENINYGKPGASLAEIERASKMAHAHEFIKTLPSGYKTMVGERGVKLSGGQRQRVAIARAILKDAPILVLDEATSALDSESEKLIQDALQYLMVNRTAIVIAHRLSTIQKMDRIIVLENGKIVEQGSHKELLTNQKTYAKLWKHQSGGFLDG